MAKTIYIPTLMRFQKYTKPYYEAIQYTGSEDIIKALHGFIEGLIDNNIMDMSSYFDNTRDNPDVEQYFNAININKEDDEEVVIQKICNFVKTENDFEIVRGLFALEYDDCEVSASYSVVKIEVV